MSLDVYVIAEVRARVYRGSITHNLSLMAEEAGIHQHLWRPEELGITKAGQLIEPLEAGLERLRADRAKFEALSPANGWGSYDGLCEFVADYLEACRFHPNGVIEVSR